MWTHSTTFFLTLQADWAGAGGTAGRGATGSLIGRAIGCAVACVVWTGNASAIVAAGAVTLAFVTAAGCAGCATCVGGSTRCAGAPPPAQPTSRKADVPRGPINLRSAIIREAEPAQRARSRRQSF